MNPEDYEFLARLLKTRSGLILGPEKGYLVEARLTPIARARGLDGVPALIRAMRARPDEAIVAAVVDAMTTNETFFFRDKNPFDALRDHVLPDLITRRRGRNALRVWCAAASTGQEPYSIAMILKAFGGRMPDWRIDLVGTDISPTALARAKAGLYSQFEVQRGLPVTEMVRWFDQTPEGWRIHADLRQMVSYRRLNLLEDFSSLGTFDIVFCRNVLIYFDVDTKRGILDRMARSLTPDGYLFLGASETVMGITDRLRPAEGLRGVYAPVAATTAAR